MSATLRRPIFSSIERKLTAALQPLHLNILDESHKHAGHSGNRSGAEDAETHFSVEMISPVFEGKSLVARHRLVYDVLKDEMQSRVHALSLKLKTPAEATPAQ
eukprot:TRINITY_DN967_c5_g1_i1.p2 TRINITY_DN967_c5_g1~~TRINITY_DN967_c5_g1_i1.p2  ORF type:complete len:103 (-),score=22.15 TRINITY_DN967_c5_g1_i1:70-378(-)